MKRFISALGLLCLVLTLSSTGAAFAAACDDDGLSDDFDGWVSCANGCPRNYPYCHTLHRKTFWFRTKYTTCICKDAKQKVKVQPVPTTLESDDLASLPEDSGERPECTTLEVTRKEARQLIAEHKEQLAQDEAAKTTSE